MRGIHNNPNPTEELLRSIAQINATGSTVIGNSLISTVVPLNGHEVLFTATSGETGVLRILN